MQIFSKIFQQTFWQVLGKAVTALSTFIILGLVTRNYGQEGTGIFTLALTYLAIFYLLSDFGFNAHVLKRIKNQESRIKEEWKRLLGTRIIWSAALVILALGLLPFLPFATPGFNQSVYFGVLAIIGSGIFVTCNLFFQSRLRYDLSVMAVSFGTLISLGIFFFLIKANYPVPFLLIAHFFGWFFITLAALYLIRSNIIPIFNKLYTINLFKESWPIAVTLGLNILYFRADAFLIAYFKSISDVGIYNVAFAVFQSALVLPSFIMNAYYPTMLKSLGKIKLIGLGLFGLSLVGTVATIFFAPVIIKILTGSGFAGSITSLQILSFGFPAYFLSSLLMWLLIAKDRYKTMLAVYMSGLIFNIILNLIFIPKYSYIAASWTTVISEYFILLMQIMVLWLKRK